MGHNSAARSAAQGSTNPLCGQCNHPATFHGYGSHACEAGGCHCPQWAPAPLASSNSFTPVRPLLVTLDLAAAVLAVERPTVERLIARRFLESVEIEGARRIPVDALYTLVDRLRAS